MDCYGSFRCEGDAFDVKEERMAEERSRRHCMELACSRNSIGYKEERMELGDRELRMSVFGEAGIVAT